MTKIVINADDFGLSRAVNYGILDSHTKGIVTSTTMMMNASATNHAIRLAKDTPSLEVGVHLVLTYGKPLLPDVPSLTDDNGLFQRQANVYLNPHSINLMELEREWCAQIEAFLDADLTLSHIDSHHHVHGIKEFYPVIKNITQKYGIPARRAGDHFIDIPTLTDVFLDDFYGEGVVEDYFIQLRDKIGTESVEVMTHPAYLDETLIENSSYNHERLKETRILINSKLL